VQGSGARVHGYGVIGAREFSEVLFELRNHGTRAQRVRKRAAPHDFDDGFDFFFSDLREVYGNQISRLGMTSTAWSSIFQFAPETRRNTAVMLACYSTGMARSIL
jgi:hypothetical protein